MGFSLFIEKKIIFKDQIMIKQLLPVIMLLFTEISSAQNQGDNLIIVHGSVKYSKIAEALFKNGFSVMDYDSIYIKGLKVAGPITAIKLEIYRTDSTVLFQGFGGSQSDVDFFHNWDVAYSSGLYKKWFMVMNKICISFGLPVSYLKQNN